MMSRIGCALRPAAAGSPPRSCLPGRGTSGTISADLVGDVQRRGRRSRARRRGSAPGCRRCSPPALQSERLGRWLLGRCRDIYLNVYLSALRGIISRLPGLAGALPEKAVFMRSQSGLLARAETSGRGPWPVTPTAQKTRQTRIGTGETRGRLPTDLPIGCGKSGSSTSCTRMTGDPDRLAVLDVGERPTLRRELRVDVEPAGARRQQHERDAAAEVAAPLVAHGGAHSPAARLRSSWSWRRCHSSQPSSRSRRTDSDRTWM
jgi:hypothetical protein